jgi:hypothetical protein
LLDIKNERDKIKTERVKGGDVERVEPLQGDSPLSSISQKLIDWLSKETWTTQEFVGWLLGYEFPPFGDDDEPYVLILLAIEVGKDGKRILKDELAKRTTELINRKPDVKGFSKHKIMNDKLLYNLLLLAACIKRSRILAGPLTNMRIRGKLSKRNYLAISLSWRLDDAISHQYE